MSTWSVDVHVVWGLSFDYFLLTFSAFLTFFPGSITVRIHTFWAQLLHHFSTGHF